MLFAGRDALGRILDLPCGHGRVLRVLRAAFPGAELTACDIDRDAVDLLLGHLEQEPFTHARTPGPFRFPGEFDLIWCGSLLTHLDQPMWVRFLQLFRSVLAPGGILRVHNARPLGGRTGTTGTAAARFATAYPGGCSEPI